MRGLIGKKIGMTQVFSDNGSLIPVTIVEAGPCVVTQVKTKTNDGYDAVQVGYSELKDKHSNKAQSGHFNNCLLYTSPSPRDRTRSRMPSSA